MLKLAPKLAKDTGRPTFVFLFLSLVLFTTFWALVSLPQFNQLFAQLTGVDILNKLGSGTPIGPKKILGFKFLAVAFTALSAAFAFQLRRYPRNALRVALLAVIALFYTVSIGWPEMVRYDRFAHYRIETLPLVDYPAIFSRDKFDFSKVRNTDEFYGAVNRRFEQYRGQLAQRWQTNDDATLKSIFYMNTVAGLWQYRECISASNPPAIAGESVIQHHLRATAGCCTDYAMTLKLLLDKADIPNRLAYLPGHVFNEAKLKGNWQVLDSTINVMFNRPWEEVSFKEGKTVATVFPHPHLVRVGNPMFSQELGGFQIEQLTWAMQKGQLKLRYDTRDEGFWGVPASAK